jgi:hypothetical protein
VATVFSLLLLALLALGWSAGYLMGLERNRRPRRNGGSGPRAVLRRSSRATIQPSEVTRRIAAYCNSTPLAGGVSGAAVTQPTPRGPNSSAAVTSSTAYRAGMPGRTPPDAAGWAKRLEAFERRYPATAAMARARNLFPPKA